jgi:hypothetical protein
MPPLPNLPKGKIKLSEAQVEKCVKVIPAFYNTFKSEKARLRKTSRKGASANALDALLANKAKLAKVKNFAFENGYSDFNEFIISFSGVMMTYALLKLEGSEKLIASKLKQLPPQMAAMLKPQIDALRKMKKQYKSKLAPETIKAVTPYVSTIDKIISPKGRGGAKRCCQ